MSCKWFDKCVLRKFEEQGKLGDKWKKEFCNTDENWMNCKRYQETEEGKPHPDNMLPDGTIDENLV